MRFSVRQLPDPPAREVADYSAEERSRIQQQFAQIAAKCRRYGRIAVREIYILIGCIVFATFGFLGTSALSGRTASWLFPWILIPAGTVMLAFLVTAMLMPRPDCPGCSNRIDRSYGPYCPECGSRALESAGFLRMSMSAKCGACHKIFSTGRQGAGYMRRWCSHCGLKLDDEGY